MAGAPHQPDPGKGPDASGPASAANTPRWVYVSGLIVVVLVVMVVVHLFTGGGPQMHGG